MQIFAWKHICKKLVPISKNIIKEKSKCAIRLTERTFIHEVEDKCYKRK